MDQSYVKTTKISFWRLFGLFVTFHKNWLNKFLTIGTSNFMQKIKQNWGSISKIFRYEWR